MILSKMNPSRSVEHVLEDKSQARFVREISNRRSFDLDAPQNELSVQQEIQMWSYTLSALIGFHRGVKGTSPGCTEDGPSIRWRR